MGRGSNSSASREPVPSYARGVTSRKPARVTWESWVERQIREARERGQFDDLPGSGKPLPSTGEPYDETWWIRDKARREQVSLLPATLVVRKRAEHLDEHLHELRSEADVRAAAEALNAEIVRANRFGFDGPPSRLLPRDTEDVVAQWRERRRRQEEAGESTAAAVDEQAREQARARRRPAWLRWRTR